MTTEKILSALYRIANATDYFGSESALKKLVQESDGWKENNTFAPMDIPNLIKELTNDLYKQEARKSGKSNALAAVKRIMKTSNVRHPASAYAYKDDGAQWFCDGFRMVGVNLEHALPVEYLPEKIKPLFDGKYAEFYTKNTEMREPIELELPDKGTLKAYIKQQKAVRPRKSKEPIAYDFGMSENGKPMFICNAEYLLDMMEIIPNATCEWDGKFMCRFFNDYACGMLLGVRRKEGASKIERSC